MADKQIRRFCKTCDQKRLCTKSGVNHILHLILSVFTASIWFFLIWLPLILLNAFKPYRCTVCGEAKIL